MYVEAGTGRWMFEVPGPALVNGRRLGRGERERESFGCSCRKGARYIDVDCRGLSFGSTVLVLAVGSAVRGRRPLGPYDVLKKIGRRRAERNKEGESIVSIQEGTTGGQSLGMKGKGGGMTPCQMVCLAPADSV